MKNSNESVMVNLTRTTGKGEELLSHDPLHRASKGLEGGGSEGGRDDCGSANNNVDGSVDGEMTRGDDGESKGDKSDPDGDSDGDWVPPLTGQPFHMRFSLVTYTSFSLLW